MAARAAVGLYLAFVGAVARRHLLYIEENCCIRNNFNR